MAEAAKYLEQYVVERAKAVTDIMPDESQMTGARVLIAPKVQAAVLGKKDFSDQAALSAKRRLLQAALTCVDQSTFLLLNLEVLEPGPGPGAHCRGPGLGFSGTPGQGLGLGGRGLGAGGPGITLPIPS